MSSVILPPIPVWASPAAFLGYLVVKDHADYKIILFLEKPEIGNEFGITLKSSEGHEMRVSCKKVWWGKYILDETVYNAFGVRFTEISPSNREIIASMVEEYYLV
ncbi:MAG: PilZ domain-containing protein [Thermodesulfobacteriota bacterium]|nr:PilZ domain-containing protein [Thermodesulfobacteriota bacterium]